MPYPFKLKPDAMLGMTAKQWREANPNLKSNIRDYVSINGPILFFPLSY